MVFGDPKEYLSLKGDIFPSTLSQNPITDSYGSKLHNNCPLVMKNLPLGQHQTEISCFVNLEVKEIYPQTPTPESVMQPYPLS